MKSFLSWKGESEMPNNKKEEALNESFQNSFSTKNTRIEESLNLQQQDFRNALRNMFNPGGRPPVQNYAQESPTFVTPPQEIPREPERSEESKRNKKQREEIDTEDLIHQEEFMHSTDQREESDPNTYKLYRDKEETFECNVTVEGASLSSSQARIIIDTSDVSLVFYGKIYKDGRCLVPLKKMKLLPEETKGRIRLEVVVDDTLFVPWESPCKVEGAKKVKVEIKPKKSVKAQF